MDETQFVVTDPKWWLVDPDPAEIDDLRSKVGQAFGWPDHDWYQYEGHLGEVYQTLQKDHPNLIYELDTIETPDDQSHWLQSVLSALPEHDGFGEYAGETQAGEQPAGHDEAAWQAFLAQNAPHWDGAEESWEQFREWFAYYANEQGLSAPATSLLDYLTAQSAAERIVTFAQYGVTIGTPQ